jgi:general secretion pathway protein G
VTEARRFAPAPSALVHARSGPYLKKAEGLVDPWGGPILPGRAGPFDVLTLGRDNAAGGMCEDSDVTT